MKNFLLVLIFNLLGLNLSGIAQVADSTKEFIDFRRINPAKLPPIDKYAQPKEQVFPLGFGTSHPGELNTGTGIWTELNPKVPRVTYVGLHFMNKDTGWACGGSGAIIKTTNGGTDWLIAENPINNFLLSIDSYNGQVVITTGYDGLILRSNDGGNTFEQIISGAGDGDDLWGVKLINDTLGWTCGKNQTLLRTTDAGLSWQSISPEVGIHYWALDFLNSQYGFLTAEYGLILKTTNGGTSWNQLSTGDYRRLFSIDIIDSLHIAAAGEFGHQIPYIGGKNIYSSDGGTTWIINPDIPSNGNDANGIDFINIDTGYVMSLDEDIYKTTDRGQSWNDVGGGGSWHIQILEDGTGYAGGEELGFYKKEVNSETWDKIFLNVNWSDVYFIDEQKGFLISNEMMNGGLYKTVDGGLSYQKIENAPSGWDILFLDSLTGFIAGKYKTVDGGENWYTINGGERKVLFISNSLGWSTDDHIYKTTNQGESWDLQLYLPYSNFWGICFIDSLNGWAVSPGYNEIYSTTNGGSEWIQRVDIQIYSANDVYFNDLLKGWVISGNELYYTLDGGNNWILDPQIYTYTTHFETITDNHFIITGTNIYESIDSGQIWQNITNEVGVYFTSLQAPTNYLAFCIGPKGLILKYVDTTYVPVEIISFSAKVNENSILLFWNTATEANNKGFEIQRSEISNQASEWKKIGWVDGYGTATIEHLYSFTDKGIATGRYYYRLKQIDYDGRYNYSKEIEINIPASNKFYLEQNYPNPFNPESNIGFTIPEETNVSIKLYDITGREIKVLVNEKKQPGYYTIKLKGGELSSGVYFCRLVTASGSTAVKKLILLK